jgi:tight adherence protein B
MNLPPELLLALAVALGVLGLYALIRVVAGGPARSDDDTDDWEPRTPANRPIDRAVSEAVKQANLGLDDEQAVGVMALTGAVLAAMLYFWKSSLLLAAVGLTLGVALPVGVLLLLRTRRRRKMQEQLPDALFTMARTLRAGLSLEDAIATAGLQSGKPLGEEFNQTAAQIRLGLPIPRALQNMADRIRLIDFDAAASAIGVSSTSGGSLPQLLERLAAVTRDHNQYRGQFQAATAQARTTALMIGLIGPAIAAAYYYFQPAVAQTFLESRYGIAVVIGAIVVEVLGILVILRILKVEY